MASLPTPPADAPSRSWRHGAIVGATLSIGAASVTFALSSGLAAFIARQVVVPAKVAGKLTVLKLDTDPNSGQQLITLPANTDTRAAGTYALRFDEGQSMAQVARDLDLTESSLRAWVDQARADRSGGKTGLTSEERAELTELRKENRQLRMEREILKKAAAFFAKESS